MGLVMDAMESSIPMVGACFVLLSEPTEWTLLRNNRLEVLGPDDEWIEYYGRAQVLELAMVSEPR
jgi:hypothetical protein